MPEEQVARLSAANRVEQRRAAALHPLGHRVVEQFGQVRRNMRAQHVDLADRLDLGGERLVVDLIGSPVDRCAGPADETENQAADLGPLAVEHRCPARR